MRLIDADYLKILAENTWAESDGLIQLIDETKTAYDVDKVVEKLQSEVERWEDSGKKYDDKCEIAVARGLRNAIEIVKQGGVDVI